MKTNLRLFAVALCLFLGSLPLSAATWFVRSDGGTRYSSFNLNGQCNGQADAPYPGSGVNQACAYSDVRYLWADGGYTTVMGPHYQWVIAGGGTVIVDCPQDCRVGYSGPDSKNYFLAMAGNPGGSGIPVPPAGSPAQHTRILGKNYANCMGDSEKARLNGGYGLSAVLNLKGSSYVDVACLDISDHSDCGRSGQVTACHTGYPMDDYANYGIVTNNTTTNTTITDVRIHGMAAAGMIGPTGDGVSLMRVALVGNPTSGWNMDAGNGTTGTGNLTMYSVQILWNGCAEEYPIVDPLPYQECTDDSNGGYGDGIGTATAVSVPAWHVTCVDCVAAYNTQDGFDFLHVTNGGSTITMIGGSSYSNMGNQLKVGSASTTIGMSITGNCNALRQSIPGTPDGYNTHLSDFCRGGDQAIALAVINGQTTTFSYNQLWSANATGILIVCGQPACDTTASFVYDHNYMTGFFNSAVNGYAHPSNQWMHPFYFNAPITSAIFTNPGSHSDSNSWLNIRGTCPYIPAETNTYCGVPVPVLSDGTWHLWGNY
jgi:hypothetical protein